MTWLAPLGVFPDTDPAAPWPIPLPLRRVAPVAAMAAPNPGMTSATAGRAWRWVTTAPAPAAESVSLAPRTEPARVRIPADLLGRMSFEAHLAGVSESEIWAEAARAWLRRRSRDDDFPPTPPAAAQPCPRRERTAWVAIDALLIDLRACPSEPAAA